jgi:NADPH:quinone reductase-like Zn-dependent oxidoreductase
MNELSYDKNCRASIDRRYSLKEVAEAIRYLEEGHARGKIVITIEHDDKI